MENNIGKNYYMAHAAAVR